MSSLATLQTNVAAELGLVNDSPGDQPQITAALNKAVVDMLRKTHCYVISDTMGPLTIGTGDYDLDSSILAIDEVYMGPASASGGHTLERISSGEMISMRAYASSAQGSPLFYALMGANRLLLSPIPAAADTLTIYQVPRPTAMSSGSHDPSNGTYGGIPAEFHDGLELYAEGRLASLADDASSAQGVRYQNDYKAFIREMKGDLQLKGGKRLARILPPARRRGGRLLLQPGQRDV